MTTAGKALKKVMAINNINAEGLAERLGISTTSVYAKLKANMSINKTVEALEAMGWKLCFCKVDEGGHIEQFVPVDKVIPPEKTEADEPLELVFDDCIIS